MTDDIRVIAGDCTVTFRGARTSEKRGRVLVVIKPDKTVLVHDADGYQPVEWLTRPETLAVERDPVTVRATDGDQRLGVIVHDRAGSHRHAVSPAGLPLGECPDCGGSLVRAGGTVTCVECDRRSPLPVGATVLEDRCFDCGLPRVSVRRGEPFEICTDGSCESLAATVRERFDREWSCPDCGEDLRILERGGLVAGCAAYPDCESGFALPDGVVAGHCDCGLPIFETATGRRCLDPSCNRGVP